MCIWSHFFSAYIFISNFGNNNLAKQVFGTLYTLTMVFNVPAYFASTFSTVYKVCSPLSLSLSLPTPTPSLAAGNFST